MNLPVILDLAHREIPEVQSVVVRQGESGALTLKITITENKKPFDLTGYEAYLKAARPDGAVISQPCTIEQPTKGGVSYTLTPEIAGVAGKISLAHVEIRKSDTLIATTDDLSILVRSRVDMTAAEAKSVVSEIEYLKELLHGIIDDGSAQLTLQSSEFDALKSESQAATTAANTAATNATTAIQASEAQTAACTAATNAAMDVATTALSKRRADTLYANALIGSAQGDMVHVEDAWEADAVGLGVRGKSVQDGTPTPDAPIGVDVVDGPVRIMATRKNLVGSSESDVAINAYHGVFSFSQDTITCVLTEYWAGAYGMFSNVIRVSGSTFYMSFAPNLVNARVLVQCLDKDLNVITSNKIIGFGPYNSYYHAQHSIASGAAKFTVPNDVSFIKVGINFMGDTGDTVTVSNIQLELGSTATTYEPYTSTQQTITLPHDRNYLASLPDGTRDELALRSDGVAVLTERVEKIASYASQVVEGSYVSTTGELSEGATIYYAGQQETRYSADNGATWTMTDPAAGTSAIPLFEGINNVWCTDALSPTVDLDYVQDTNKVINELRAAIVASGATS